MRPPTSNPSALSARTVLVEKAPFIVDDFGTSVGWTTGMLGGFAESQSFCAERKRQRFRLRLRLRELLLWHGAVLWITAGFLEEGQGTQTLNGGSPPEVRSTCVPHARRVMVQGEFVGVRVIGVLELRRAATREQPCATPIPISALGDRGPSSTRLSPTSLVAVAGGRLG